MAGTDGVAERRVKEQPEAAAVAEPATAKSAAGERELTDLIGVVRDAAGKLRGPLLIPSVLGWPASFWPVRYSEYRLLYSFDVLNTLRYLSDVLVPSAPLTAPDWVPAPLAPFFFHPTRVMQHPDQYGSWTSNRREKWLFINGILTDEGVAQLNAEYIADLFHRPITVIQNSTDGAVEDLAECAVEKAFGRNGEAATVAFPAIYDALKDPQAERVVVVAHSQGTIIASVILHLMKLIYRQRGRRSAVARDRDAVRREMRTARVDLDLEDFDELTREDINKLELYCFANCATKMRYVDAAAGKPWIESFGNQYDLVARLGMLAPHPKRWGVEIDGPRYERPGAWGHLLNRHYLRAIDQQQRTGNRRGPAHSTPAPYKLLNARKWPSELQPRLYRFLNGGDPLPA
ncbi:MAG: hypothetical protein ACXVHB_33150 [Solirubrobacteraceae bacterium]